MTESTSSPTGQAFKPIATLCRYADGGMTMNGTTDELRALVAWAMNDPDCRPTGQAETEREALYQFLHDSGQWITIAEGAVDDYRKMGYLTRVRLATAAAATAAPASKPPAMMQENAESVAPATHEARAAWCQGADIPPDKCPVCNGGKGECINALDGARDEARARGEQDRAVALERLRSAVGKWVSAPGQIKWRSSRSDDPLVVAVIGAATDVLLACDRDSPVGR